MKWSSIRKIRLVNVIRGNYQIRPFKTRRRGGGVEPMWTTVDRGEGWRVEYVQDVNRRHVL